MNDKEKNDERFDISSTLKNKPKYKKNFWTEIKKDILGADYELSLVFIGDKLSQKLNNNFRKKDYKANIISFIIADDMGEIFINYPNAKREAKKWYSQRANDFKENFANEEKETRTVENFIDFLLIHGMTHLKGYDHIDEKEANEMEKVEEKIRKKFKI